MDLRFENHGSLILMYPETREGRAWIKRHIHNESPRWGAGVVIEPRYVADVAGGARQDGLLVPDWAVGAPDPRLAP